MVNSLQYLPKASLKSRSFYIKICAIDTVITPLICRNILQEWNTALLKMLAELASGSSTEFMTKHDINHD